MLSTHIIVSGGGKKSEVKEMFLSACLSNICASSRREFNTPGSVRCGPSSVVESVVVDVVQVYRLAQCEEGRGDVLPRLRCYQPFSSRALDKLQPLIGLSGGGQ